MSFIELARKKRSIRKYKPDHIPDELIKELLEAARLAPSGCNAQPWKYIVIKDKKIIKQLLGKKIFWQNFIYNAPLIIIGCGDPLEYNKNTKGIKSQIKKGIQPIEADKKILEMFKGTELTRTTRDVTISMVNMAYRAEELGLGTCFVGSFYGQKIKKFLQLPQNIEPILSLTIGYPAESPSPTPRKPLTEIIHKII